MSDPIIVVPYDPTWPDLFRQIAAPIRAALGDLALRIDHIGSTSIPGTDAKPIIDIQISVASFEPFDDLLKPMESLGWRWRSDNPDLTDMYFRESPGTRRTHIHMRRAGSWSEQMSLLFRDYLRCHPEDQAAYVSLKYESAEQFRNDRKGYTASKSPLIWSILFKADRWAQEIGWQPGPSDQ